jgi:hypothetical protein
VVGGGVPLRRRVHRGVSLSTKWALH